jgi:hypothetical protein
MLLEPSVFDMRFVVGEEPETAPVSRCGSQMSALFPAAVLRVWEVVLAHLSSSN